MRYLLHLVCLLCWIAFLAWGTSRLQHRPKAPAPPVGPPASGACLTPAQKQSTPHLIAQREMVANWRITAADLTQPPPAGAPANAEFAGKYLACKVGAGDPVVSSDLRSQPQIPLTDKKLYLLPLRAGEETAVNAGTRLDLFADATANVSNAEVMAVVCSSRCEAVLQLTPAEVELLKPLDPSKLKKIIR